MTGSISEKDSHTMIKKYYTEKAHSTMVRANQLKVKYNQYAFVRLFSFLGGAILVAVGWTFHLLIGIPLTIIFLVGFYRFILWHQDIKRREIHNARLSKINEEETQALENDFSAFYPGDEFLDPLHPYLIDLDFFGKHSIFQSCNRTVTVLGRKRLANFLSEPAEPKSIKQRQVAISELEGKIDWRQDFQAIGMEKEDDELHLKQLNAWLDMPLFFEGKDWLKWMRFIVPVWMFAGLVICFTVWPLEAFLLFLALPVWILRQHFQAITEYHERTAKAVDIVEKYGLLIAHVEKEDFDAGMLKTAKALLESDEIKASKSIQRLAYIISQLNVRYNIFAIILSLFVLWEFQWLYQLDKWKAKFGEQLPLWFESLQLFDAMNSMSVLKTNNPDWINPEITLKNEIEAEDLGHPLIHRNIRVPNSITLPTDGHIKLITGSNMGGKSTFLRTLGLNVTLAMSGLPVCATKFALPPLRVYTSMRTQDSLHESTSSFWAELKRLKQIISAVEQNQDTQPPQPQILFLLDEILKGTNSADRHKGSRALILQLIAAKGSGLVATHDLELGELANLHPDAIENWCFEVAIEEGKLSFDYKLKPGISKSFNATILMREMGIRV